MSDCLTAWTYSTCLSIQHRGQLVSYLLLPAEDYLNTTMVSAGYIQSTLRILQEEMNSDGSEYLCVLDPLYHIIHAWELGSVRTRHT